MRSRLSDELRRRQIEEDSVVTPGERIRRSLEIGRRELRMFMTANGLSYEKALETLRSGKEKARRAVWAQRNR